MLVRSEDKANFRGEIEVAADKIWASYSIEGQVNGDAVKQADKRMLAFEQEARMWLVGEAEHRGFHGFKPETRTG